jgi:hypothetical protein
VDLNTSEENLKRRKYIADFIESGCQMTEDKNTIKGFQSIFAGYSVKSRRPRISGGLPWANQRHFNEGESCVPISTLSCKYKYILGSHKLIQGVAEIFIVMCF